MRHSTVGGARTGHSDFLPPKNRFPLNAQNQLVAQLSRAARTRLLASCKTVDLTLGEVLCDAGQPTTHAFFPVSGFISLVAHRQDTPGLEVGMVGSEGMLGVQLVLGVRTAPLHAVVQGAGQALRIAAPALRSALADSPALQGGLNRYIHVLMAQLATAAPCVRFHPIVPRLARWLLMSHDRAGLQAFQATHQFLAYMLGVRRAGVSVAAEALQKTGLIRYERGLMTIVDRPGLEAAACGCYASDAAAYASMTSSRPSAAPRRPRARAA